jgi:hypothetical protein
VTTLSVQWERPSTSSLRTNTGAERGDSISMPWSRVADSTVTLAETSRTGSYGMLGILESSPLNAAQRTT